MCLSRQRPFRKLFLTAECAVMEPMQDALSSRELAHGARRCNRKVVRDQGNTDRMRRVQRPEQPGTQADPPTVADRVGRVLSDDELVDEAGEESFPASDPPAWTRGSDRNIETSRPDP